MKISHGGGFALCNILKQFRHPLFHIGKAVRIDLIGKKHGRLLNFPSVVEKLIGLNLSRRTEKLPGVA